MKLWKRQPRLEDDAVRATWQCVSLLLDYPADDVEAVRHTVPHLPDPVREPLETFLAHRDGTPIVELRADYVETFDTRRRGNLFLTYFVHGDTRQRGMALLRFKDTYEAAGVDLDPGELPDHLCVVLEFAGTVDLESGRALLLDHRAGFEVLRLHLRTAGSPWVSLLDAVAETLPTLAGDEEEAIRRLVAAGPPKEEVGLTPYGTPSFDAALMERTSGGPVDLPMPTVPIGSQGSGSTASTWRSA
ncbi:nitrate reductase molybdenum cofactor assembly chaperone [Nocardioides sp. JQ2195]|uniref:nitrate reductase molybdenum cofactor assembly chaperone n=1 Tax=Nocardioides sp. JQ2195 TaxID=2592334 RepID=UPI00143E630D|nr:nitrate reductase molybdenum cofactor assembly chaperone [Nocardioides sp. JQ2195]QIX25709.1 nitrate reductase molybdenum cofactor assembly chaperone [Nocardioides sp. JQ2195]